jgi:hypothetical protein
MEHIKFDFEGNEKDYSMKSYGVSDCSNLFLHHLIDYCLLELKKRSNKIDELKKILK